MKFISTLKYILLFSLLISAVSCKKDEDIKDQTTNELDGWKLAQVISNATHRFDVYTRSGSFQTGYNSIVFKLFTASGAGVNKAEVSWAPLMMHMMSMSHACPYSPISKKSESLYSGYIIFQMAGNESEYWELEFNYTLDGQSYSAKSRIEVGTSPKRVSESFQGSDNKRYVMALTEPAAPVVGINTMRVLLYEMKNMMEFVPANGFKILIDPRMPGMGNHGSPNNVDLSSEPDGMYQGKLSLTMTGYWKVNMQLLDPEENVIKGEAISDSTDSSSLFFEIEF